MAANGSYRNPADKPCWETCQSCYRCARKGEFAKCGGCSGRFDLNGCVDPNPDDKCRCTEGILQYERRDGRMIQVRFKSNPFKGQVHQAKKTQDEDDWNAYVNNLRERFNDENYNPIQVVEE